MAGRQLLDTGTEVLGAGEENPKLVMTAFQMQASTGSTPQPTSSLKRTKSGQWTSVHHGATVGGWVKAGHRDEGAFSWQGPSGTPVTLLALQKMPVRGHSSLW